MNVIKNVLERLFNINSCLQEAGNPSPGSYSIGSMLNKNSEARHFEYGASMPGKVPVKTYEVTSAGPDGNTRPMVYCVPYGGKEVTPLAIPLEFVEWQQIDAFLSRKIFKRVFCQCQHFMPKEQRLCKNKVNWLKNNGKLCHAHKEKNSPKV